MKRALVILSQGFEEMEAVTPIDLLRRAGIEVLSASAGPELLVEGGRGIRIQADAPLSDCLSQAFDMVILPGGPGVEGMRKDARVLDLVRRAYASGTPLAAICSAPLVLADAGVAAGHVLTSFPADKVELQGRVKAYSEERVVLDGKLITSRGAGSSEEFALALIAFLAGPAAAQDVRTRIVAR
ncbi:MAG: DJ-1 family glyoxalase III [Fibrobacteria bacterium]